jgi:hypothetical protein
LIQKNPAEIKHRTITLPALRRYHRLKKKNRYAACRRKDETMPLLEDYCDESRINGNLEDWRPAAKQAPERTRQTN